MSDVDILAALIERHARGEDDFDCLWRVTSKSAKLAAEAIVAAGFRLRDPELEARVERLEAWTRGELL